MINLKNNYAFMVSGALLKQFIAPVATMRTRPRPVMSDQRVEGCRVNRQKAQIPVDPVKNKFVMTSHSVFVK
jgi:hypothetical protein